MPPQRGQGQWALGHREPLNPNERVKRDDDGLQRQAADHRPLPVHRLRRHRPGRPAQPVPLVRAVHPARARASPAAGPPCWSRRSSRTATSCSASASTAGTLTHRAAARDRGHRDRVRPRRRRRHRPAERPAALDPDRGRAGDLAAARGGRPGHHRGLRRHPARHPRLPAGRRRRGRGARRRRRRCERVRRALHRRPGVLQPAAQVQDVDLRLRAHCTQPRDQRRRVRRRASARTASPASTSGSAAACPPTRCSASGSARSSSRPGRRGLGRGHRALPRLRLPPAPGSTPG